MPPAESDLSDLELGRFRFRLLARQAGGDGGITIHVFGPVASSQEEVLRFDCFEKRPHYHLGWSYRQESFVPIDAEDPLAWALDALRTRTPELLERADAEPMTGRELELLSRVAAQLARRAAAITDACAPDQDQNPDGAQP